jgi:mono/diheme cytochrome c family protein
MRFVAVLALVVMSGTAAADSAEQAAYAKARPVFEKHCARCHTKGGAKATAKKLDHFDMTSYPFGGHHAGTIGKTIRKVLAIGGGKPTMPADHKGAVKGDELALIAAWCDAFDAAHKADSTHHHH